MKIKPLDVEPGTDQTKTKAWSGVDKARLALAPARPEGYFTLSEYGSRYSLPFTTALGQLNRMLTAGKLERIRLGRKNYYRTV